MDKVNSKFSASCGKNKNSPPHAEKIKNKKPVSARIWERLVPLTEATREWDIDFWQAQKPQVRFLAAWGMVADFYKMRGKRIGKNTLRLQRTVENIKQA